MAVSKAWLCTKICEMAGHVRKRPSLPGLTKRELLIVFAYWNLSKDAPKPTSKQA